MLDYNPLKTPIYSKEKDVFTRGAYEWKSMEEVARVNPGYIYYLAMEYDNIHALDFIDENPDYFHDMEV